MKQCLWRIATNAPDYTTDDPTGEGARRTGGRWNRKGTPLVYCATNIALACVETLVHRATGDLPLDRYLVRIDVPAPLWRHASWIDQETAPVGWDAHPPSIISLDYGERWVQRKASALLFVPSVVVPEEFNVVVNPTHPDAKKLAYVQVRKWTYDLRLWRSPTPAKQARRARATRARATYTP